MQGVRYAVEEFCERVVKSAAITLRADVSNITDRFFCYVERKPHLRKQYMQLRRRMGTLALNSQIGRWIKMHFDLRNAGTATEPASSLIESYTRYRRRRR